MKAACSPGQGNTRSYVLPCLYHSLLCHNTCGWEMIHPSERFYYNQFQDVREPFLELGLFFKTSVLVEAEIHHFFRNCIT